VSVLAHVFEAAGIATVVISSVREVAEKIAPPRALHGEFPLGRPIGKPNDAAFQHDVLSRAFALLDAPAGPVLVDHPVVIEADEVPAACPVPARFDSTLPAAVDEARGMRKAYDRALVRRGVSSVGRVINADQVPHALGLLDQIARGADWTAVGLPGNTIALGHDIRSYYEEAALELITESTPSGRAIESWFFEKTEAGATVLAARQAIKDAGAPRPLWFYMAPGHR
jgi:hypothetical protein